MRQRISLLDFFLLLALFLAPSALQAGDTCRVRGHLTGVDDGYRVALYVNKGRALTELASDTVRDGRFSMNFLLPEGENLTDCSLLCDSGLFSSTFARLWVAPGVELTVEGNGPYPCGWQIGSPLPEQKLEQAIIDANRPAILLLARTFAQLGYLYPRIWPAQGEERKRLEAERTVLESRRDSLEDVICEACVSTLERTSQVDTTWIQNLYDQSRACFFNKKSPLKERIVALYRTRLSSAQQTSPLGQEMATFLFPPKTVGEGSDMADGELFALDGSKHKLSEYLTGGKYLLLDFWSSGCGPCIMAFPELKKFAAAHADEVVVASISIDPEDIWRKASEQYGLMESVNLNDLKGETGIAASYGVNGIPHYVIISPAGKVVKVQIGYGAGMFEFLWQELKAKQ